MNLKGFYWGKEFWVGVCVGMRGDHFLETLKFKENKKLHLKENSQNKNVIISKIVCVIKDKGTHMTQWLKWGGAGRIIEFPIGQTWKNWGNMVLKLYWRENQGSDERINYYFLQILHITSGFDPWFPSAKHLHDGDSFAQFLPFS